MERNLNFSYQRRNCLLLILTAFIWGTAFVAQSSGGQAAGPYTFNCARCIIGFFILLPVIKLLDFLHLTKCKPNTKEQKKTLILGGILCGIALCIGSNFQQMGLYFGSSAGKAGFLTACYILLVPLLGLFFKKPCGRNIWLGVFLTVIGLYLLCMNGSFSLQLSDVLLLLCALVFAIHILIIDYFSPLVDGVRMSCIQFLVCGLLTAIPMFFIDMKHSMQGVCEWSVHFFSWSAWIPILYGGVFSCGVGYTLQIVGQQNVNPTIASLLLSLESVFSVLAGWLLLREKLGIRELSGCALIFTAIILAQLPAKQNAR